MSAAKKVATNQASIYLPEATHKRLKIAAVERGKPFNTLVCEALSLWWAEQPEAEKGPLFSEQGITPSAEAAAKQLLEEPPPVGAKETAPTREARGSSKTNGIKTTAKPAKNAKTKS